MVGIREKRVMDMSIESRSRQFGKVFDHWQIKEFLGSGSGGKTAVFRLQRIDSSWGVCALKIVNLIEARGRMEELTEAQLTDYQAAREECSRNAEREVRLMDELRGNTNIVDYLDHTFVDWSEENAFGRDLLIRMELLTDLRSELRQGKCFAEAEIIKIGRDICTALVRCHSKNILHRDVKPENIFRNKDGDYKLGDFGVSRVLDTCPGAVASTGIGTYEYWPAEQMTGSYDKRVDIYSLGLVLYELSNRNRLPFASSTYVTGKEVSLRLSGAPMTAPTEVSPALARVILKACAFKPEDRYQSAEDFLRALDWLSRKNHAPIASPEFLEQDVPSVRFETVPARPSDASKTAFETQPAQNWAPNSETQPARSRKNTGGSYLKEQNRRKKRKNKRFLVFLTALLLCIAVGVFTGQRIWMINKYSAAKKLLDERKFVEAITAFEALGDYQDSPEQMENARLAADYEAAKALLEAGKNEEAVAAFEALGDYQDSAEKLENARLAADDTAAESVAQSGVIPDQSSGMRTIRVYKSSKVNYYGTPQQGVSEYDTNGYLVHSITNSSDKSLCFETYYIYNDMTLMDEVAAISTEKSLLSDSERLARKRTLYELLKRKVGHDGEVSPIFRLVCTDGNGYVVRFAIFQYMDTDDPYFLRDIYRSFDDNMNRVSQIQYEDGMKFMMEEFEYNADNQLTLARYSVFMDDSSENSTPQYVHEYSYDSMGRCVLETVTCLFNSVHSWNSTYTYDVNGTSYIEEMHQGDGTVRKTVNKLDEYGNTIERIQFVNGNQDYEHYSSYENILIPIGQVEALCNTYDGVGVSYSIVE